MSNKETPSTGLFAPRMEIGQILIPIDFSPDSRLALRYGIALARRFSAKLFLIHIVESNAVLDRALGAVAEMARNEQREEAARMLPALFSEKDRTELQPRLLVEIGAAPSRILAATLRERVDLVIMGTQGLGMIRRSLIGTVTQDVLKTINVPVLTLCHGRYPQPIDRILLATKLSSRFHELGLLTAQLARSLDASLIAFHAVDVGIENGAEEATYLGEERVAEAQSKLKELLIGASGNTVVEARLAEDSVPATILKCARNHNADLIVVGIRKGQSGLQAGPPSIVDKIIREATVPVLSIPVPLQAVPEMSLAA